MLRILIAVVLLAHGIGHTLGPLQVFKVATVNAQWNGDSWLLSGFAGSTLTQVVGVSLWTLAIAGFAAVAAVIVGWLPAAWWQPLAVSSALVSLVGLLLFPIAFPPLSTLGALVVDVAVLVAVAWYH